MAAKLEKKKQKKNKQTENNCENFFTYWNIFVCMIQLFLQENESISVLYDVVHLLSWYCMLPKKLKF